MRGEVQAADPIGDLPLGDGEVGEDGEAGQVDLSGDRDRRRGQQGPSASGVVVTVTHQPHGFVLGPRGDGEDLRGGVEAQRRGRGQQVHHRPERLRIGRIKTRLLGVNVDHARLRAETERETGCRPQCKAIGQSGSRSAEWAGLTHRPGNGRSARQRWTSPSRSRRP